jgi:hypothetical protein
MTSALEASGPKKYVFAFSILLDGLAHISAIFLLKMQKKIENRLTLVYRMLIASLIYRYPVYQSTDTWLESGEPIRGAAAENGKFCMR